MAIGAGTRAVERRWVLAGGIGIFATLPGQTIFIAQFVPSLRAEHGLADDAIGLMFTASSLCGALVLVAAGRLVDRAGVRPLLRAVLAGLAAAAAGMAVHAGPLGMMLALAGLRALGQGMLFHVAMTGLGRWFGPRRGWAVSRASLGFSLGEAVLPIAVVAGIGALGWRAVWWITAAALLAAVLPLLWGLLRDAPPAPRAPAAATAPAPRGLRRRALLRDPLFVAVAAIFMAPPFVMTIILFHQAHLGAVKGWPQATVAAWFPLMSAAAVAAALAAGHLVDRIGAARLLPAVLPGMGLACGLVAATGSAAWVPVILVALATTNGFAQVCLNTVLAEVWGLADLGAVRGMTAALTITASALGPGLAGLLIGAGLDVAEQAAGYAALVGALTLLALAVRPALRARALAVRPAPGGR